MGYRITDSMLESMVKNLNEISKCRYGLSHAYGRVSLIRYSMECTGISNISTSNTKSELYYQMSTLFEWLRSEEKAKTDYVKNCPHLDVFNISMSQFDNGQKHNVSHIREIDGKYQCITCQKDDFTKQEYEASQKPRSQNQLRKMRIDA